MFAPMMSSMRYAGIRAGLEASALAARVHPAGGRGLIFTLHHIRPENADGYDANAILSITPRFLDQAIEVALSAGLTPVHIHDLPGLLADKRDDRRFLAFALDDGYRNNLEHAAPVFRRHNVPFTIFVTAGFVNRSRTIWWETVGALLRLQKPILFDFGNGPETVRIGNAYEKSIAASRFYEFARRHEEDAAVAAIDACARSHGIEPKEIVDRLVMTLDELRAAASDPLLYFGAHTVSHVNLTRVSEERLEAELSYSATWVKDQTGYCPRSLAYPYGWSSAAAEREFAMAARLGFDIAVTTRPGVLRRDMAQTPTRIPRVSLNGLYQSPRFVRALISGLPFTFMRTRMPG